MRDPRVDALAQILVRYSTNVRKGDVCSIAATTAAEPLVQAIYEEVLRAGGLPIMQLQTSGAQAAFYELAGDEQLDWVPPTTEWTVDNADVHISVMASLNTRELSNADPKKQARHQKARKQIMETSMRRAAEESYRWALTLFPTHAYAGEAGMSLPAYEDFYYAACLADDGDPVSAWERQSEQTRRLTEWIQGREEVRIRAEGTVNGEIRFSFPASYGGRSVSGVRLRFEDGKVVDASAEQGEEFLIEMLDTDPGARRLGELGIGTNYGIATGTKEILLDEKIGGTVHLAIGMSYPETGGTNSSAVHWDMVCDLRRGGSITVDGVELQRDGRFLV